jgi:hypothetical protein
LLRWYKRLAETASATTRGRTALATMPNLDGETMDRVNCSRRGLGSNSAKIVAGSGSRMCSTIGK